MGSRKRGGELEKRWGVGREVGSRKRGEGCEVTRVVRSTEASETLIFSFNVKAVLVAK